MATRVVQDDIDVLIPSPMFRMDPGKVPIYVLFPDVGLEHLPATVQAEMPLNVDWEKFRAHWREDKDCWWVDVKAHPPSPGLPWVPRDVMVALKGTAHPGPDWDWAVTIRFRGFEAEIYVRKTANW